MNMKLKTEYGTEKIQLEVLTNYFTGGLSIGMNYKDNSEWMPYGELTTTLPTRVPNYCAFVDTNNYPGAIEFIEKYQLGEKTEFEAKSGFCTYPLYLFNAEKLRKLCPEGMEEYERSIGVIKESPKNEKKR